MHDDTRRGFRFEMGRMFARLTCGCLAFVVLTVAGVVAAVAVNGPDKVMQAIKQAFNDN